ncbi:ATP-dependent DNA helicase, partial [Miniphocaeibacter sp.]|uniref:ATP-dependent DNA helicase n=1 Tax=Miniphocaeibacter sp. TaxID=3100973 RepID=UPI003BB06941
AQLPPVGEGQPFHDIIHYFPNIVSRLTTCYRATEAVFKAATCIRNGDQPLMQDESEHEKWKMVATGDARSTHQYILNLAKTGYLDFNQDIILTPRNDDEANGAAAIVPLNKDLVDIANPREAEDTDRFKAGDRILNTKNMPNLDIWNGTTGTVVSVEPKGRLYIKTDYPVTGDDGETTTSVTVPKEEVKHFKHAYALTVHKSQGSQYRKVVFVVLQRDAYALLDRAMIYTGVTRAKQECLVVGELRAFADAIRRNTSKATVFQQLARLGA